jgi:threonylcarbamoyladenosine tRNA methylthiotransferase MtaB
MKSFTITTLGCKVNRYESEAISEQLQDEAWQPADTQTRANLCIVNTCTVTQKAAMQSRQAVRRAVRSNPGALVAVTGCYAQVAPEVFTSMQGVHYVVGNTLKDKIVQLVSPARHHSCAEALVEDISGTRTFQDLPITRFGNRTRPFVKIQDGCGAFCAYCIIPHARGPSRSLRPEIVVERTRSLKESGYCEVVLCGINIGRYGQDLVPATSLTKLMRSMDGPQGVKRLRLSSIEPCDLSEDLIRYLARSDQICPHLHIPLQSGDDEVLKRMNRPYSSKSYRDLIHDILSVVPDVAIGVDVLAGFPGETGRAFENTCRLIEQLPVFYLHVFPFSMQRGTPAAALADPVPPETIKNRCRHLRFIGRHKRNKFCEKFIGCSLEVLIEGNRDRSTGYLKGLTRNYIPVLLQGPDELFHQMVEVRLTRMEDGRVFGERASGQQQFLQSLQAGCR